MIYDYKIKNNILYLYCNFQQDINFSPNNKEEESFFHYIQKYIKRKKIPFTGTVVAIVVEGIIISKIYLKPNTSIMENPPISSKIETIKIDQ